MGKTKRAVIVHKEKRGGENVSRKAKHRNKGHHSYVSDQEFELYLLRNHGLQIHLMRGDGNCLFRSIAHQLQQDPEQRHYAIRSEVVQYMEQKKDFYSMFLEDDVTWDDYIDSMKVSGTWGGYQELCAASSAFNLSIHVYQWNEPKYVIQPFETSDELNDAEASRRVIMLSFHDGCHYNSLRPADPSKLSTNIQTASEPKYNNALPPKKDRKLVEIRQVLSKDALVNSISRAVSWVSRDEILAAVDWADDNEEDAIELLCSHLHNLRAMLATSEGLAKQSKSVEKMAPSIDSVDAEVAPNENTSSGMEVFETSNVENSKPPVTTTSSGRPLSKKEQRQRERQEKENAKRKPQLKIAPTNIVSTIKKINVSPPTASSKSSNDMDSQVERMADSMREIIV